MAQAEDCGEEHGGDPKADDDAAAIAHAGGARQAREAACQGELEEAACQELLEQADEEEGEQP